MALKHVSINEVMKVLQKAGVPFDNATMMEQVLPGLGPQLRSQQQSDDPVLGDAKAKYKAQLQGIADMDAKLAKVYGDPTSELFIEHPLQREQLQQGASNTGYQAASTIANQYQGRQSQIEREIDEVLDYYGDLAREQRNVEDESTKLAQKQAKKATSTAYSPAIDFNSLLNEYTGDNQSSGLDELFKQWGG